MTIWTHKWTFTPSLVQDAPEMPGLYALWSGDRVLCVGRADGRHTLRKRLLEHLQGSLSPHPARVTHYSWEICLDPAAREAEILRELGTQLSAQAARERTA